EEMETLLLNTIHVQNLLVIINRLHMLLHSTALAFLFYYRLCFLFQPSETIESHSLPWLLVFASEIILSFIWILDQAYRWHPVLRSIFQERLLEDHKLPSIDVFICTADPTKEPTLDVMNTVLSAMALDYPPQKLHMYVSDEGGSPLTLHGVREASKFARSSVYMEDKQKIKEKYEAFKEEIKTFRKDRTFSRDHPSVNEVMQETIIDDADNVKMPLLVCVSREKKPSDPHHFKAGAFNVLISSSLAFVQFPQKFHSISKNDIYDSQLRSLFTVRTSEHAFRIFSRMDGLMGPVISGTDLLQLKEYFGSSNEFIRSLAQNCTSDLVSGQKYALLEEPHFLASCNYEIGTK
ncbi:Cellulose synthase-like protein G2, partial [Glycine soja]